MKPLIENLFPIFKYPKLHFVWWLEDTIPYINYSVKCIETGCITRDSSLTTAIAHMENYCLTLPAPAPEKEGK